MLVGGGAALTGGLLMPEGAPGLVLQPMFKAVLLVGGFLSGGTGLLTSLGLFWTKPRHSPSLQRGEQPIERWTVDAETWQAFVKLNDELDGRRGALSNVLSLSELPATGVEIVVAPDGVVIGPEFFGISGLAAEEGPFWMEGPPPYFEFRFVIRAKSTHRFLLRFPSAPVADGQAARVWTHFTSLREQATPPLQLRRWRNIALVVAGCGAVIFAAALLIAPMVADQGRLEVLMTILTVVGFVAGMTGLFLAVIWQRVLVGSKAR